MKIFAFLLTICLTSLVFSHASYEKYDAEFLAKRYHFKPQQIIYGYKYPIVVSGTDGSLSKPSLLCRAKNPSAKKYDIVIIGGGPAGLTSAYYLLKAGKVKNILLLERNSHLGGLATGKDLSPKKGYARGGAYFTGVDGTLANIYKQIGLENYKEKYAIEEPTDSYYWNGKLYINIWDAKTLARLPADFSVFKYIMEKNDDEGFIPEPPLDQDQTTRKLDKYNFGTWLNSMPSQLYQLAKNGDKEAKSLLFQLKHDKRVNPKDKMQNIRGLLNIYSRSALGEHSDFINAAAFTTFYYSELEKRYASNKGAGGVISKLISTLQKNPRFHAMLHTSVSQIKILKDSTINICYEAQGKTNLVNAKYVVFSAPLFLANKLINNLSSLDKEKYKAISKLEYRNYQVTNLLVKGHPLLDTYDLWIRNDKTYSKNSITDIIDGRWIDFKGSRIRNDDKGVLTVYHPLPKEESNKRYDQATAISIAEKDANTTKEIIDNLNKLQKNPRKVNILLIHINRWPYSIAIIKPNHFLQSALLERPVGNIYFANNNIGMPSIEDAVYRGWKAALKINQAINSKLIKND